MTKEEGMTEESENACPRESCPRENGERGTGIKELLSFCLSRRMCQRLAKGALPSPLTQSAKDAFKN